MLTQGVMEEVDISVEQMSEKGLFCREESGDRELELISFPCSCIPLIIGIRILRHLLRQKDVLNQPQR